MELNFYKIDKEQTIEILDNVSKQDLLEWFIKDIKSYIRNFSIEDEEYRDEFFNYYTLNLYFSTHLLKINKDDYVYKLVEEAFDHIDFIGLLTNIYGDTWVEDLSRGKIIYKRKSVNEEN